MAQFGCGGSRCTCQVTAGPGIAVTGNGSASNPFVVEAEDGGGVTCDQVRPCLSAGDGIAYDPATGEIAARPSTDAGNSLSFGTDGGLLVPPATPGDTTAVEGGDTDTVETAVSGAGTAGDPYVVSSSVRLDADPPGGGTNLIGTGPDGLFLECEQIRGCLSAGDGLTYDSGTGEFTANISGDTGNATTIGTDGGIFTPAGGTAVEGGDTDTVETAVSGAGTAGDPYVVSSSVR
ncbi:hypothetical protein ACFUN6_22240, partial [Streptomyces olivaceus]